MQGIAECERGIIFYIPNAFCILNVTYIFYVALALSRKILDFT